MFQYIRKDWGFGSLEDLGILDRDLGLRNATNYPRYNSILGELMHFKKQRKRTVCKLFFQVIGGQGHIYGKCMDKDFVCQIGLKMKITSLKINFGSYKFGSFLGYHKLSPRVS